MSNKRATTVGILTAGIAASILATTVGPAAAQGNPVGGKGNVYFLSGALNSTGIAQATFGFGDANDEVYFGDWYGTKGVDLPMVRRGNVFYVPNVDNPNITQSVFAYGDAGDKVMIGDWDGDGKDSITIRRGNEYFVKNDTSKTGIADTTFNYGDAGDTVLVGNWDGGGRNLNPVVYAADGTTPVSGDTDTTDTGEYGTNKTDTLMVQRSSHFFVKNDLKTGVAEYEFYYGDAGDSILVGDWATYATKNAAGVESPAKSGDFADQLAVRRGNAYFKSSELEAAFVGKTNPKGGAAVYFGDPGDAVFTAKLASPVLDSSGKIIYNQVTVTNAAGNKLSTDGLAGGGIVYDKDGIPVLKGYVKDSADAGTVADSRPVPATNPSGGILVTAWDAKGTAVTVAPTSMFTTDGTATGGYLFDKDGTPYLSKKDLQGTGTDTGPIALADIKLTFLAGNDTDATVAATATAVFDKQGVRIFTTTAASTITGDGFGVRR